MSADNELEVGMADILIELYNSLSFFPSEVPKELFKLQEEKWKNLCEKNGREHLEPVFWTIMKKERPDLYRVAEEVKCFM